MCLRLGRACLKTSSNSEINARWVSVDLQECYSLYSGSFNVIITNINSYDNKYRRSKFILETNPNDSKLKKPGVFEHLNGSKLVKVLKHFTLK